MISLNHHTEGGGGGKKGKKKRSPFKCLGLGKKKRGGGKN